jgi:hypothetical protein
MTPEKCESASCRSGKPAVYHLTISRRVVRLCEACYRGMSGRAYRRDIDRGEARGSRHAERPTQTADSQVKR